MPPYRPKRHSKILLFGCLLLFSTLSSCTIRPRSVLPPRKMEAVLYDLHRAEGVLQAAGYNTGKEEEVNAYYESILMKQGVTQASFDSSLVWYTDNPKQFCIVYGKVVERLKKDNDRMQEESTRIAREFYANRNRKAPVDSIPLYIIRRRPVLLYITLQEPYSDYSIKEQPLSPDFRYIAFPAMQDSICISIDSTAQESIIKNAKSKSQPSYSDSSSIQEYKPKPARNFKRAAKQLR